MHEFNLLGVPPSIVRDAEARARNKDEARRRALAFGEDYFDGAREHGYGGYCYDGRWRAVASRAIAHWHLKPGDRVVDIGCAKGFFVKDLRDALPGLDAMGLDVSDYALKNAHPDAKSFLSKGTCESLPFPDRSLAAAFAINTIHNLDRAGCIRAIREVERVAPGRGFVQVDAYRTEREREIFLDWMLTAKTFDTPEGWRRLFGEAGYTGAFWWTILEEGPDVRAAIAT